MPTIELNDQGIYYRDTGGSGPPVVFLHGFLMDQSMFDPQVEALAGDFRCIRFDARAFGQTRWDGKPFDLYDTVADTFALLDYLGIERATLAGMSQGGYAALRAALRAPERVGALVLMSTSATAEDPQATAGYRQTRDLWRENDGPIAPLLEGMMGAIIGPQEQTQEHWRRWTPRWRATGGEQIFHAMNNLLERDDISSRLSEIHCPALVTHGDADHGIPIALGEVLDRQLPGSVGLVRVPGAAHAANMTHPQVVNPPLRDFLSRYGRF